MRKLDSNAHSVFLLYYHLILVIKYRKKVLNDPISNRAREIFEHIAPNYHITLEEWNHDQDHVHIMFRAHPKSELSKFINAYKSASSAEDRMALSSAGKKRIYIKFVLRLPFLRVTNAIRQIVWI